jgi:arginyl-tRNA synthetase
MITFKDSVSSLFESGLEVLGIERDAIDLDRIISRPPNPAMGELAIACFSLSKRLRKSPVDIAEELVPILNSKLVEVSFVSDVKASGPYLNFSLDLAAYSKEILPRAIQDRLLVAEPGKGKTIVIDFSSPNVAKPFGIGHLRSTAIGAALGRIYRAQGFRVVGVNHIGDWGTQFGKLISAWKLWGDEEKLDADPIGHLYDLYVRFHEEEKENPSLTQEARDWFRKLEEGDEQARELWSRFREESLTEFDRIYRRMGVTFDHVWGEAFYEDKIEGAITRLERAGVLEESDGAQVVRVDSFFPNTSPCLIRRSDGASLYTTRDVAAAFYRYDQFEFDRCLYVTGADQVDHFNKVFGTLKCMALPWADRMEHIPFGRIQGISTRRGTLIFLEDVFDRAAELSLKLMKDRDLSDEEKRLEAEKIGVGAVIFFDLSKERIKDADFDWDAILQITGRTGPGLQYTQVRLKSLIRRYRDLYGDLPDPSSIETDGLVESELKQLMQRMGELEKVLNRAASNAEPAVISRYLLDLADIFNSFYSGGHKVLTEDRALTDARITVCQALLSVLLKGLNILGVPAPNRM